MHVTGIAVKGKRKGEKLRFLPSTVMNWGDWKRRYPTTTVLLGRMAPGRMGARWRAHYPDGTLFKG